MEPTLIILVIALVALFFTVAMPVVAMMVLGVVAFLVGFMFAAGVPLVTSVGFYPLIGMAPMIIGLFMVGFARWAMHRP